MTVYKLVLENYMGGSGSDIELYHSFENAVKRYEELRNENYNQDEFEESEDYSMSFFDPNYNEYSTEIYIIECTLESLFYD